MSEGKQMVLGFAILIAFVMGLYIYQGGPAEDADEWIPLLQIMIPIALFVGTPLILTLIIVAIVKAVSTGATIAKQVVTGKDSLVADDDAEEWVPEPVQYATLTDINKRHRKK